MHFPTLPSFDFNHDPAPQSLFSLCNHLKLHRSAFADDNPREVLIKPRTLLPNRIRERQTCAYTWLRFRKLYYAHSRDVSIQPIRFFFVVFSLPYYHCRAFPKISNEIFYLHYSIRLCAYVSACICNAPRSFLEFQRVDVRHEKDEGTEERRVRTIPFAAP